MLGLICNVIPAASPKNIILIDAIYIHHASVGLLLILSLSSGGILLLLINNIDQLTVLIALRVNK